MSNMFDGVVRLYLALPNQTRAIVNVSLTVLLVAMTFNNLVGVGEYLHEALCQDH